MIFNIDFNRFEQMFKFKQFFLLSALMITTVMGSSNEGKIEYSIEYGKQPNFSVELPDRATGLAIKNAIYDMQNIPVEQQNLISRKTSCFLKDDEQYSPSGSGNVLILTVKPALTDPIKISFLGAPKFPNNPNLSTITSDTAPLSIVGDLVLQLGYDATVNDLAQMLFQQPALRGKSFYLAVDNVIFSNHATRLADYRGKQFQILTFQS